MMTDEIQPQTKTKTWANRAMYTVALVYPLTTIPQIMTIFHNQSSANVSLTSWSLYALCSLVSLFYALAHKLRPLIVEGLLWSVMYAAVITGIVLYR
jgi:uncharacterized protein with PQ loop repeat